MRFLDQSCPSSIGRHGTAPAWPNALLAEEPNLPRQSMSSVTLRKYRSPHGIPNGATYAQHGQPGAVATDCALDRKTDESVHPAAEDPLRPFDGNFLPSCTAVLGPEEPMVVRRVNDP